MPHKFSSSNIQYEICDVCNKHIGEFHITKNDLEEECFIIYTINRYIDVIEKALTSADISYNRIGTCFGILRNEEKLTIEDVLSAFDNIKI